MQASDIPAFKFNEIWAKNAGGSYKTYPIPVTTGDPTRASLDQGFPPDTFIPTGAGGNPPYGADFNGAFEMVTGWGQWLQAGGVLVPFDSGFSTAIGGYPKGAILASASLGSAWLNLTDNNTTNPDSAGVNWQQLILPNLYGGTDSGTANAVVTTLPATGPAVGGYTGFSVKVKKGASANTGATTLNVGVGGAISIVHPDGSALSAGDLPAGGIFTVVFDGSVWQLQGPSLNTSLVQAWAITDGSSVFANHNVSSIVHAGTGIYTVTLGISLSHGGAIFYSSGTSGGNSNWGGSGNNGGADITSNTFTMTTNNAGGSGGQRADITATGVLMVFGVR